MRVTDSGLYEIRRRMLSPSIAVVCSLLTKGDAVRAEKLQRIGPNLQAGFGIAEDSGSASVDRDESPRAGRIRSPGELAESVVGFDLGLSFKFRRTRDKKTRQG